jgi:7-cyano-7-deazaguanine reductase
MGEYGKILKTFDNEYAGRGYSVVLHCPEFTSLCPYTGNPDFAVIDIIYTPDRLCIETKSLKLYLQKFRTKRIFNEHAVNMILDDIVAACKPVLATVSGDFNVRGGIGIHVEASHSKGKKRE